MSFVGGVLGVDEVRRAGKGEADEGDELPFRRAGFGECEAENHHQGGNPETRAHEGSQRSMRRKTDANRERVTSPDSSWNGIASPSLFASRIIVAFRDGTVTIIDE